MMPSIMMRHIDINKISYGIKQMERTLVINHSNNLDTGV